MTERAAHPNYVAIGICLAVLMIAGVALCEVHWGFPKWAVVTTVLGLSTVKAGLVALYFMHLKTDRRLFALVALIPFVLIALALGVVFSSALVRL